MAFDYTLNISKTLRYLCSRYNVSLTSSSNLNDALIELLIKTSIAYDPMGFEYALYFALTRGMEATPFHITFIPPDSIPLTFGVITSRYPDERSRQIISLIAPSAEAVDLTALIYIVLVSPFAESGLSKLDLLERLAERSPEKILDHVDVRLYRLYLNYDQFQLDPIVDDKAKKVIELLKRDLINDIIMKLPLAKLRWIANIYSKDNMPRVKIVVEEKPILATVTSTSRGSVEEEVEYEVQEEETESRQEVEEVESESESEESEEDIERELEKVLR